MDNLLPPSIDKPHTRALVQVFQEELAAIQFGNMLLYLLDTCDAQALPYLARQFNVLGNRGWRWADTELKKRELLKRAVILQRKEGTPFAIKESLKLIGIENPIILHPIPGNQYNGAWNFNGSITYGGAYHWACFKILVDTEDLIGLPDNIFQDIADLVNEWKSVRDLLVSVEAVGSIEDSAIMSDEFEMELDISLSDKVGPNNYDGEIDYNGEGTYSGEYDEFSLVIDPTEAFRFAPSGSGEVYMLLGIRFSESTNYEINWGGTGIESGESTDGVTLTLERTFTPTEDITIKVGIPQFITSVGFTTAGIASVSMVNELINLSLFQYYDSEDGVTDINGMENLPAISEVYLTGNAITVTSVRQILADLVAGGVSGGTLDISGQIPPAPPGAPAAANIATLESNGWTITTD